MSFFNGTYVQIIENGSYQGGNGYYIQDESSGSGGGPDDDIPSGGQFGEEVLNKILFSPFEIFGVIS